MHLRSGIRSFASVCAERGGEMQKTLLTTALIVLFSLPAQGQFVANYAAWRALSEGVNDGM